MSHLICVGIDPALVAYILTKPEAANLSIDTCRSLEEARPKISTNHYDFYILDPKCGDCGPLVEEIRTKNAKGVIGLVANDNVKIPQQINAIIKNQQDLDQMLFKRCEETFQSRMTELKHRYDADLDEKMAHVTNLARSAKQNPELLKDFKLEIHKIAGTAGSFGYGNSGDLCRVMESEIHDRMAAKTEKEVTWLASLETFVKELKESFHVSSSRVKPLLYVVDDDVQFLDLLERLKESYPIDLIVEFDPQKALHRLQGEFKPQGIVASQIFRSSSLTGFDIINTALEKNAFTPPIFALLLEKDDIELRVEAMRKGSNYVFCKPVSAHSLLQSMSDALQTPTPTPLKVLVVDDDKDFCDYVSVVLAEIGISTLAIQNPINLFKEIEDYQPNILLLDIMMPKYDGLNLLRTIRQDVNLKNLIIIVLTGYGALDTRLQAYAANVDDILSKPIDKNLLQKRVLNIAERRGTMLESGNYTGLMQQNDLMEELKKSLARAEPSSFLALFEVDKFADWSQPHGVASTKDLIVFISNQLQWESDYRMKCFWVKASQFAVVFEKMELEAIENQIYLFLSHLIQNKTAWHLAFNCSIVPISKEFGRASELLQAAEKMLSEACQKEAEAIRIVHKLPKEQLKKQVMLVDSNEGLLKMLKQAFESHNLSVSTCNEGKEALNDLQSESQLPSLIIVERNLPDMDGMDLCLELKRRFRTPIPIFMLTVFAADKDISDGIKQGVEYIVKPFNISLLVQKALRQISSS